MTELSNKENEPVNDDNKTPRLRPLDMEDKEELIYLINQHSILTSRTTNKGSNCSQTIKQKNLVSSKIE